MTRRVEFTRTHRSEMRLRATDENGVLRCEGCGCDLTGKRVEFDHVHAEALVRPVHPDRPLTAADGQLLGECCHRGPGGKTARDVAAITEAKRREGKHFGLNRKMQGRGFEPAPRQHTASRPIVHKFDRLYSETGQ